MVSLANASTIIVGSQRVAHSAAESARLGVSARDDRVSSLSWPVSPIGRLHNEWLRLSTDFALDLDTGKFIEWRLIEQLQVYQSVHHGYRISE